MSTKLPALVPFNDPVTICAFCDRACCLVSPNRSKRRCDARSEGATATVDRALADVQAAALEHPSYWKGAPDHDIDMPLDVGALHELVRSQRKGIPDEDRSIIAGYLEHELGIDPDQVAEAMAKEWPEAGGAT